MFPIASFVSDLAFAFRIFWSSPRTNPFLVSRCAVAQPLSRAGILLPFNGVFCAQEARLLDVRSEAGVALGKPVTSHSLCLVHPLRLGLREEVREDSLSLVKASKLSLKPQTAETPSENKYSLRHFVLKMYPGLYTHTHTRTSLYFHSTYRVTDRSIGQSIKQAINGDQVISRGIRLLHCPSHLA